MLYRKIGKLDVEVSLLGFGAMRFPADADGNIDKEASISLLREAVDSGINYIDTAYVYPKSEKIIAAAMKDGYREKVYIADKIAPYLVRAQEDKEALFGKCLGKLDTEYIDFFLVHNLTSANWAKAKKWDLVNFFDQKKKEGKIKYLGFSFHDDLDLFKEIVDAYDWDFCQIQLNYMDKDFQAGEAGLKYAADKGMGVIVMEPLKGGRLVTSIPPTVQAMWDESGTTKSPAEMAFKWAASHPEVSLILSGMSSSWQLAENVDIFSQEDLAEITEGEKELLDKIADEYRRLTKYGCTGCRYCVPCPQKIDIPSVIKYYNDWLAFDRPGSVKFEYTGWLAKHASDCAGCKLCEEKCPQSLPIAAAMSEAAKEFGI